VHGLLAAGTGLRISECLGLQWRDVNFADGMSHVRRSWMCGQVGLPKSKASRGAVPLHPLLAEFMLLWKQKTTYSQPGNWVFPSTRLNGKLVNGGSKLCKLDIPRSKPSWIFVMNVAEVVMRNSSLCLP
jgi:integrase